MNNRENNIKVKQKKKIKSINYNVFQLIYQMYNVNIILNLINYIKYFTIKKLNTITKHF